MSKTLNVCNNCGKQGHSFHNCKLPITSYGIILFTSSCQGLKFLMIRRKDSFGYIDFIRGKYSPYNVEQLQNTIEFNKKYEKHNTYNIDKLMDDIKRSETIELRHISGLSYLIVRSIYRKFLSIFS